MNLADLEDDKKPASSIYNMYGNFGLALYTYVTLNKVEIKLLMNAEHKWLDAFFKHYFSIINEVEDVISKQSNSKIQALNQANIRNLLEFESKYSIKLSLKIPLVTYQPCKTLTK